MMEGLTTLHEADREDNENMFKFFSPLRLHRSCVC